jgi:ribosome-associated translation inhibitor RaiA
MESQVLGGNIVLTGFSHREFTDMIVVKKIVGQYARKLTDTVPGFTRLTVTLKDIHQHEGHGKLEIHARAEVQSHELVGEAVDHNLYVALDTALKHALVQAEKLARH